jgi:hypothetical protein
MRSRRVSRRASKLIALAGAVVLVAGCGVAAAAGHLATTSTTLPGTANTASSRLQARPHTPSPARVVRHVHPTTTSTTTTTTASSVPPSSAPPPGTVPEPSASCSAPPLAAPAAGLVVGQVSAIGDSVLIDIEPDLQADVRNITFDAYVGQQWYEGVSDAQQLRADGQLGSVVVIELGTNGPIDSGDVSDMMQALNGASRVVLVTNFVPDEWQDPNNEVIEAAATQYKNVAVANWEPLAAANPGWFYDGVGPHMPIGGPGAQAMASLIAGCV